MNNDENEQNEPVTAYGIAMALKKHLPANAKCEIDENGNYIFSLKDDDLEAN